MNPVPAAAARSTSIAAENKKTLYMQRKLSYDRNEIKKTQRADEKSKLTECSRERCPYAQSRGAESIFTGNS